MTPHRPTPPWHPRGPRSTASLREGQTATRRRASVTLALALTAALGACGPGEDHRLGTVRDESQPGEPFLAEGDRFVGRWIGQAREPLAFGVGIDDEAPTYIFPSGSARIELWLVSRTDAEGRATIGGSVTFGAGEPPPPAIDATSGYPVGFNYDELLSYGAGSRGEALDDEGVLPPLEGFDYALASNAIEAGVPDGVLRVTYDPASYLAPWCALQSPHPQSDGTFGVLPYAPGGIERVMADGTNRPCSGYGPNDLSECPENMDELPRDEYVATYRSCARLGAILYQMSCDRIFLSRFCSCDSVLCHEAEPPEVAQLLLRASDEGLIGAFEGARFLNARGLPAPIGEVRFVRSDD
jgi:hypothetical protein